MEDRLNVEDKLNGEDRLNGEDWCDPAARGIVVPGNFDSEVQLFVQDGIGVHQISSGRNLENFHRVLGYFQGIHIGCKMFCQHGVHNSLLHQNHNLHCCFDHHKYRLLNSLAQHMLRTLKRKVCTIGVPQNFKITVACGLSFIDI